MDSLLGARRLTIVIHGFPPLCGLALEFEVELDRGVVGNQREGLLYVLLHCSGAN